MNRLAITVRDLRQVAPLIIIKVVYIVRDRHRQRARRQAILRARQITAGERQAATVATTTITTTTITIITIITTVHIRLRVTALPRVAADFPEAAEAAVLTVAAGDNPA